MDEEQLPPLQYASVVADGDAWAVSISHPAYNGGAAVRVIGYRDEDGANEGARWWDAFVATARPDELIDLDGSRYGRVDA